jgi:Calx-beta domain
MARITVRRSRTMRDEVSFKWWTESGTAKPGQDFVPVKTRVEYIENGKNSTDLVVPLVRDPARRTARNFYVVIDEASDNAALGPRTLTMVTIPGAE